MIGDQTVAPSAYVVPLTHCVVFAVAAAAACAATAAEAEFVARLCLLLTSACSALASVANVGSAAKNASARVAKLVGSFRLGGVGNAVMGIVLVL
ncbi:MAG: hypothetical protein EBS54_03405 [Betaproteobacteria bacterium]|nr:hypothetical protein [Betaproteobacteria bacterium]NBT05820.1 hypothetical protein [Betaproteobacteria bacterium]NCA24636.1 hypothetical protein [Betaproteobacteria bacterium]